MSHVWVMCYVTHLHTQHLFMCIMTRSQVWHDSLYLPFVEVPKRSMTYWCGAWPIYVSQLCTRNMTQSYVWHDSVINISHSLRYQSVPWLVYAEHDPVRVVWLNLTCGMTHLYVWDLDEWSCARLWYLHECNVWHDSFIYLVWGGYH